MKTDDLVVLRGASSGSLGGKEEEGEEEEKETVPAAGAEQEQLSLSLLVGSPEQQ